MKKIRKITQFLAGIALVFSMLCLLFVMWQKITGNIPGIFGYRVFRISSGSMDPVLMVGDVILAHSAEPSDIRPGDILIYRGMEGEMAGKIITHEVIEAPTVQDGVYTFRLQGRANSVADPPITDAQVIARYERKLPALTSLFDLYMSPWGLALILGFLLVLFFSELIYIIRLVQYPESLAPKPPSRLASVPSDADDPSAYESAFRRELELAEAETLEDLRQLCDEFVPPSEQDEGQDIDLGIIAPDMQDIALDGIGLDDVLDAEPDIRDIAPDAGQTPEPDTAQNGEVTRGDSEEG